METMKFYTKNIVEKARNLRIKGVTVTEISDALKVNRETLRRWFFDIPSNNSNHLRYIKIRENHKKKGEKNVSDFKIDKNNAKVLASLMYWCEGYKYPNCTCIGFANSDVNLIRTFLRLFRIGFVPKEEKLRLQLQLHDTHDKNKLIQFWSDTLSIPKNQFQKSTVTKPRLEMKRVNYKGTCTIRYYDAALYNEIVGTYEGFAKKLFRKNYGGVA